MPSATTCVPTIASSAPAISAWMSQSRPKIPSCAITINSTMRTERGHDRAREDEQVVRRVDEQEPQMAPAVAEARELGLAAARVVLDRELARGPASPWRPGSPSRRRTPSRSCAGRAGAARRGAARASRSGRRRPGPEQEVQEARQQRVADVAVMPGHRARDGCSSSGCRSPCRRRSRARRRTGGSLRSRRSRSASAITM